MLWSVSLGRSIYLLFSQLLMSTFWGFFSSLFLLVLKSFLYKSIYNWKFVHRHPWHLGFCWQYRRIWLGYKTRIRNFWYLFSYIFCFFFFFWLLFYLDGKFAVLVKQLYRGKWKKNMHQTNAMGSLHAGFPDVDLWWTFPRRGQNKVNLCTALKTKFGNLMRT